ncbi:MAG: ATP synthase F1 subunit delta [Phycisphaerales bacterium]
MATHTDAVSSTYARSLYEVAEGAGSDKVKEVSEELQQICELSREDSGFGELLSSPIIDRTKRRETLQTIFRDRITDLTLRFLLVLNDKERLGHLQSITDAYEQLVDAAHGRVEVDMWTAAPMGEQQLDSVRERIRAAIGKDPVIHAYTDDSMIGGVKLRIGDQLIDGSLATRLRRLRGDLLTKGGSTVREGFAGMLDGAENTSA